MNTIAKIWSIAILFSLFLSLTVSAQNNDDISPTLNSVILTDEQGEYLLGLHLEYLEDPTGVLTIENLISPSYSEQFVLSQEKILNFGFTRSVYWVRFRVRNEAVYTTDWLLEIGNPFTDRIDLYGSQGNGQFEQRQAGDSFSFNQREINHRHFVFQIPLSQHTEQTYYLRFQNKGRITVALTLWEPKTFAIRHAHQQLGAGLFYGAVLIMIGYNLFLAFLLKDRMYLYYVLLATALGIVLLNNEGFAYQYLWPNLPWWNDVSLITFVGLSGIIAISFSDKFLHVKTHSPGLHWILMVIMFIWSLLTLGFFVTRHPALPQLVIGLDLPGTLFLIWGGVVIWHKGYRPARYYLFSWGVFFTGAFLEVLGMYGIIPISLVNGKGIRIGLVLALALLSLALADRINMLKQEKAYAQTEVMKALQANEQFVREQNILLEQKVAERTSELRQSNAQLHQEIAERKRVEATLRQLEKAIETTEVGITITDNDGRIVYTNPADARMHGYTVDELIGQHANIFAPSEHRENKSRTEEEIKEFSLWKRERLNIRKDGSVFPVMLISNPISDHQGHSIGKVIVCEDITEFQQVEKALTEERNLLRTLIDTVPDYIYVKDTESRFLLANTTSAYSIGFSTPDEFVGKTDFDILPYKLAERFYADEQAIMKSGQPLLNQEEPNVNQETGKACWFSTTKAPFRNGQGKIAGIVGISRDITEHKQAKEMLQQRNRELSLINQVNRLFSSSIEWNHVLETVLRSMRRLLNITATSFWLHVPETGELICQQSIGPESEMVIGWRLALGQGIVGQAAQTGETIIIADTRADPQHCKGVDQKTGIELRSILSIPFRVKGEVSGVLSLVDTSVDRFSEDDLRLVEPIAAAAASAIENARLYMLAQQEIAERKQAEEALLAAHNELKEKNAQLQELNASKDKFFSIISHDLRSPFTALLGFAQLLAENVEHYSQDKIKHHIDRVYTSAERLHALLENLLTWARIQRGVMKHHPEPIDLSDIAEDNTALFASRAEQKQITLRDSIPKKTSVYADYSMIDTVLRNLISNALKFSQTDGIIEISAHSYETYVEVAVSDTGTGIRQENIPKLFRIDMQYTNVGTAGETGTGLGLILCQELVERNGGRIWVESDVGKGTTFRFTLPQTSVPV